MGVLPFTPSLSLLILDLVVFIGLGPYIISMRLKEDVENE
jgi:hypothetical protein